MHQLTSELTTYMTRAMVSAIVGEVSATPKPGLVDRHNSGAHRDMNFLTFMNSTVAIIPFLQRMACTGGMWDSTPEELFFRLRPLGRQAEKAMFAATNNVNTHKGMIFSMGTMAAAAGYYYRLNGYFNSGEILKLCGKMVGESIKRDFEQIDVEHPKTHGEELYVNYGLRGIRGEVQNGFYSVQQFSLPALKELRSKHNDWNKILIQTLFYLMANVEDTNVLYRSNLETMRYVNLCAQDVLKKGGIYTDEGRKEIFRLDYEFILKNISPGGCADLLAITIFSYNLDKYMS